MPEKRRVLTFYPNHLTTYGVGHAALSIAEAMNCEGLESILVVPSVGNDIKSKYIKRITPAIFIKISYKLLSRSKIKALSEFLFLMQIRSSDIIYLWPGSSVALLHKIKRKGNIVVIENINCHQRISKQILGDEAKKMNVQNVHLITQVKIDNECEKLSLCDYVFSPSSLVTQSLLDADVAADKILESSYGLHQDQQVDQVINVQPSNKPLDVIFVGRVGVRKGVHLLLEYWREANINGVLKVIGNVEDSIQDLIEPYQSIENIQFINFVSDIEQVYKEADIFVLPSLEEGSPLVSYLALGAGLPCIVSPMGGEGVVSDNVNGFVIDAHDKSGWITALQTLANSPELRQKFSQAARESSDKFLWKRVGQQRATLLLDKLQGK